MMALIMSLQLLGCTKKEDVVRIEVEDDITIAIEDYTSSYDWSSYIHLFVNEVEQPFENVTVTANTIIQQDADVSYTVVYSYLDKDYRTSFMAHFISNTITISIVGYDVSTMKKTIKRGDTVDLSTINTAGEDTVFEGWYLDQTYTTAYTPSMTFDKNTTIYGKWTFDTYAREIPATDLIVSSQLNYINHLMLNTQSYIPSWNQEGFKGRWNYIDGVFLNSIVSFFYQTKDVKYKDFFLKYINYYLNDQGEFIHPATGEKTGYRSGELDSVCASRILFDAYDLTHETKYLNAIERTYLELTSMPKTSNGLNYSHKTTYPNQIWLDGMYMYAPFYARYAKLKNNASYFNEMTEQYRYIREHMFDEDKQLYYHGHDTTKSIFWADSKTGNSPSFWLRSSGWFIVSLVDVLEYFPSGANKTYLTNLLKEAVEGIMQYQDETTKMFFQLIDLGPAAFHVPASYFEGLKNTDYLSNGKYVDRMIKNYLETSGSSMIAYALLKGTRLNYLDAKYATSGEEIYENIHASSFYSNELHNICVTAGLGPDDKPYRDGSIAYYLAEKVGQNDAKGVGPFIMAFIEYSISKEVDFSDQESCRLIIKTPTYDATYYFKKGTTIGTIRLPDISTILCFNGLYYDADFTDPVRTTDTIQTHLMIYAKYDAPKTMYEVLIESGAPILIQDDFDAYQSSDTLTPFESWGANTGIHSHINIKDDTNGNETENHIDLGNGTAELKDTSSTNGTQLIVQVESVSSGIIEGYQEITLTNAGDQWTFFQIYGLNQVTNKNEEIFGIRILDGLLKFRINKGDPIRGATDIPYEDRCYQIYYKLDFNQSTITIKVDNNEFISNYHMQGVGSFCGTKVITSDGLAYNYDENGVLQEHHRTAVVDNIIIVHKTSE